MELLNLDVLAGITRKVTLGGFEYEIVDQTVEQMVEALRVAKKVEGSSDDPEVILGSMIETAVRLLPECPEEQIRRLKLRQLAALIEFASAPDEEVVANSEVVEPTGDSPAEKPNP